MQECNGYNAKGERDGYWKDYHSNGTLSEKVFM